MTSAADSLGFLKYSIGLNFGPGSEASARKRQIRIWGHPDGYEAYGHRVARQRMFSRWSAAFNWECSSRYSHKP